MRRYLIWGRSFGDQILCIFTRRFQCLFQRVFSKWGPSSSFINFNRHFKTRGQKHSQRPSEYCEEILGSQYKLKKGARLKKQEKKRWSMSQPKPSTSKAITRFRPLSQDMTHNTYANI